MRINTKLNKIELLKAETQALEKARDLCLTLAKHGEGELADFANDSILALCGVLDCLNEKASVPA